MPDIVAAEPAARVWALDPRMYFGVGGEGVVWACCAFGACVVDGGVLSGYGFDVGGTLFIEVMGADTSGLFSGREFGKTARLLIGFIGAVEACGLSTGRGFDGGGRPFIGFTGIGFLGVEWSGLLGGCGLLGLLGLFGFLGIAGFCGGEFGASFGEEPPCGDGAGSGFAGAGTGEGTFVAVGLCSGSVVEDTIAGGGAEPGAGPG